MYCFWIVPRPSHRPWPPCNPLPPDLCTSSARHRSPFAVGQCNLAVAVRLGDGEIVSILGSGIVECNELVVDLAGRAVQVFRRRIFALAISFEAFCSAFAMSLLTVSGVLALLQTATQEALIIATR